MLSRARSGIAATCNVLAVRNAPGACKAVVPMSRVSAKSLASMSGYISSTPMTMAKQAPVTLNTRRTQKAAKEAATAHSQHARKAFDQMSVASLEQRNRCLAEFEAQLAAREQEILNANEWDINAEAAKGDTTGRVSLKTTIDTLRSGLQHVQSLPDPLGCATLNRTLMHGLNMYRTSAPLGVLMIVLEDCPENAVQLFSLAVKTGNAMILKGGPEATQTLLVLADAMKKSLAAAGLPEDALQLTIGDDAATEIMSSGLVDLVIPRGSPEFGKEVQRNSVAPVLNDASSISNVVVSSHDLDQASYDLDQALSIIRSQSVPFGGLLSLDSLLSFKYQVGNEHTATSAGQTQLHSLDLAEAQKVSNVHA